MNFPDHKLLENFLGTGDHPAFEELVRRHLGLVHATAMRITKRPVLAEEVSQLVFIKLARLTSPLKADLPLAAWLHRMTRVVAIDLVRSESRRRQREAIAASQMMSEILAPWEDISPVLDDVIDSLSASDRRVIVCRYFEGRSHSDIARSLNLSEDALRMRANRALEKIRIMLQRRGITTTAAALAQTLPIQGFTPVPVGLATKVSTQAIAAFVPRSILVKIGIITMTKKIASITAALLILAGTGAVVLLISHRDSVVSPPKKATMPSAGVVSTAGIPSSTTSPTRKEPGSKSREAGSELVGKYGESRVKLARNITTSLINLMGEDGMQGLSKVINEDDKNDYLAELAEKIQLTPGQREQVDAIYRSVEASKETEAKSLIAFINANSGELTTKLLAGDALKRGRIGETEYQSIIGNLDPRIMNFDLDSKANPMGDDLNELLAQEAFASQLKASLTSNQLDRLADLVTSSSEEAKEEGSEENEKPLDINAPQTLEELDKSVSGMKSMVNGLKSLIEGAKAIDPSEGDAGDR